MPKNLKKEQVRLLRFEKQILGLATALAAGGAVAKSVDAKLAGADGTQAYGEMQTALVNLAEATARAHEVINAKAAQAGLDTLQASGGVPKREVSAAVASILGIG